MKLEIGQELYYLGMGWGCKEKVYELFVKDGVEYVKTNKGTVRKCEDVINNTCNLYSSKEEINKKLRCGYMSKTID